ncbi:MAG: efflux transporter outer membrane subunit [Luteolibacter sp.]|nr:efflux transporter outer membrane subunit [Luteolibacter sp.]
MPRTSVIRHVLSCIPFLLGACAPVGPDYETPGMELPAAFSQGGVRWKRESPDTLPTPQAWWKLFRDPTLNGLVERSLERNQEIAASAARLKQAREMSTMARSLYFPAVDIGASTERSQFRFRGPGGGSSIQNSFAVPVDFRYELDVWGNVRRQVESASASEQSAAEMLNALRLSVAGEVAQIYWVLRAVDADRAVLDRTLEIRSKALGLFKKRRDAGTISGLDLARAETEVATANADRIRLDQTRLELVNSLAVLTGSAASGSRIPENTELPKPPPVPVSVPSELLRQRPDIRAAERNVAAANAEIGVATAAFFPAFVINASTGFDTAIARTLFDSSAFVWSLGASAMTPLSSQKYLRAQRRASIAAHEAASAEYRQTVLESIREVENALQGSAVLERRQLAQDQALAAARKTFDLSVKRFSAGLVSFLDVVDAERTRLDAERAANAIRGERLAVAVSLMKALGGEW